MRLKTVSLHAQLQLKQAIGGRPPQYGDGRYLYLQTEFDEDRRTQFWVIVVTDPQTNKYTHAQLSYRGTGPTPGFQPLWGIKGPTRGSMGKSNCQCRLVPVVKSIEHRSSWWQDKIDELSNVFLHDWFNFFNDVIVCMSHERVCGHLSVLGTPTLVADIGESHWYRYTDWLLLTTVCLLSWLKPSNADCCTWL